MWNRNKLIPIIILFGYLSAQSISTVDTLFVTPQQTEFKVNPFIIDSTFFLFHNGRFYQDYSVNTITGNIIINNSVDKERIFHASYKYLEREVPIKIGPKYLTLPSLDTLLAIEKDSISVVQLPAFSESEQEVSQLSTSGTIFRNLTISQLGGTDFSGGLQLQLQGKLSDSISVSGVLSDQSLPIQPEGTTQALEEIDKVYLHVSHPIFQIMAGDIDYQMNSGKYLKINRKLQGLRSQFHYDNWSGQAALAGTKGRYHKLSFKGTDGSQGPYFLTSETGNRDIIVLAGTEKVHLDGELLMRGENHDYIIDYSTGEITFTPRRMINFDSDIFIEYQYSDFQYNRNVLSASLQREIGKWATIGLAWFKERDQLQIDESLASGLRDSLQNAGDGDAIINGAISDSTGDYIFQDEIYVYTPNTGGTDRYKVTFQNDNVNGAYARKISNEGHLFFEYVSESQRTSIQDLYSPFRRWSTPVNQEIVQLTGDVKLTNKTTIIYDLSLSNFDRNIYSAIDDDDNVGLAHQVSLRGKEIVFFKTGTLGYNLSNWRRSNRFHEINHDRDVQFDSDWNINGDAPNRESLTTGGANIAFDKKLQSQIDWSQYNSNLGNRDRLTANLSSETRWISKFTSYINHVSSEKTKFYQYNSEAVLLPGNFHPILKYDGELEDNNHKFDIGKFGFIWKKRKQNVSASIARRIDWSVTDTTSNSMEIVQDGWFGEVDINGKLKSGWSGKIIARKRISDDRRKVEKLNYALGLANIRFQNKTSPIRWDLHSKLEETYSEARAVVYDSIGVGLGTYRYDPEFNEYIADPNGAYISHNVLTGERELNTHFEGSQRLYFDFGKTKVKVLKFIDLRLDIRANFKGKEFTWKILIEPDLNDASIARSRIDWRNEIEYNPPGTSRRLRQFTTQVRDLNGSDPRGNDLRDQIEYAIEWQEPFSKILQSVLTANSHRIEHSSGFSELRNRNIEGWWAEENLKWKIGREWQISLAANGGRDSGIHNQNPFSATAYGIKFEGLRFISKTSRINSRIEWFNTVSESDVIPPEALNGLTVGQTISINLQGQVLIGKNLSLNLTGSYIDNTRYDNFITLSGELRAYF